MVLYSDLVCEPNTKIQKLEDITPEYVISMLREVREDLGRSDSILTEASLVRVLEIVESGTYEVNRGVVGRITFNYVGGIVRIYREFSEGWCQSCVNLGRETLNAQDAESGWYCKVSDPDYNTRAVGDEYGCRYSGQSPKVKQHYTQPCESWKPKCYPKLEVLVAKEAAKENAAQ